MTPIWTSDSRGRSQLWVLRVSPRTFALSFAEAIRREDDAV
jgi:hypothetical protein